MLQKFLKCEVKVHNARIYLPLNFAWNQFRQNLNLQNGFFYHFEHSEVLLLVSFGLKKWLKFTENQNSDPLKLSKMTLFDRFNSAKIDFT